MYSEDYAFSLSLRLLCAGRGLRKAGADIGWRRLPGTLFETPENGSWELWVEGGKSPLTVRPGEIAVIPRDRPHRLRVIGNEALTTTFLLAQFNWIAEVDALGSAELPLVLSAATGRLLKPILAGMVKAGAEGRNELRAAARFQALGFRLLSALFKHAAPRSLGSAPREWTRLRPALEAIREDPSVSCAALAEKVHLSPTRFYAVFRRSLGAAPMVYVQRQRLRRACEMLIQTDAPVYAVADRCGFASAGYFGRLFRAYIGQTPIRFRASFQNQASSNSDREARGG